MMTHIIKYSTSLLIVAAATGLQLALGPIVGQVPFIFFFPAVVFASLYGDGIFAIALSMISVQVFFMHPGTQGWISWPADFYKQMLFLIGASVMRWVTVRLSRALLESKEAEARLAAVLRNALDAVVGMDDRGRITHWNPQAVATFGFTEEEVLGKLMSQTIVPIRHREAHETGMRNYLATGDGPVLNRRLELTALHKNGYEISVELSITPIHVEGKVSFAGFLRDITKRKADDEALRAAVRARDEFISVCSHELKTPVTSMKMQFQLAEKQMSRGDKVAISEESVRKRLLNTLRQLERMNRLIEDMLDVSRLQSGNLRFVFAHVDLSEVVREAGERFQEQFREAGVALTVEAGLAIFVDADRQRIEQVLSNLLTNALKYGRGSPVKVSVEERGEVARLTVADRGPGIAPSDLEKIFHRFERVAPGDGVGGLGLGLYISRQIALAHKGAIRAESELGGGARFVLELPLAAAKPETGLTLSSL